MPLSTIEIVGGGPAGLYTAILARHRMPNIKVRVIEQNPAGATFGFGVVFSDQALEFLRADDAQTYDLITPVMERWQDLTLNHPNDKVTLDGVGFAAIGRLELIQILRRRAQDLGVTVQDARTIHSLDELSGDLIVGADGLNSIVRHSDETAFAPQLTYFNNHFAWFGTQQPFDTLTQTFIQTNEGAFNAHHYRYAKDMSTFIVECGPATFARYGFADLDETRSANLCATLFEETLNAAPLITNQSHWRQFPKLWCRRWVSGNRVLIGDAAHTAHFSIGSGTRLALEDAICLVSHIAGARDLSESLAAFEAERQPIVRKIVTAANTSAQWYEVFDEKMQLAPLDFAYDYITRSGRVSNERLRLLAPQFMARYEAQN